jgi:glycosyltransferase involved in cell wall biosynthesis
VRILMVDLAREWRGGQSQALLLLQGLQARDHSVELLAVREGALAARAAACGIAVHTVSSHVRRLGAAWAARRLLRVGKLDVVHVNEAHALTAAWLAGAHHQAPLVIARRVTFPVSRSRISLARYRAAARILAVSQSVRNELLAAGLNPARIVVTPDGVEIPEPVLPEERERARERWKIAPDERVLALVASLTAEKGHALLLEALAALRGPENRKQVPPCRLLLAGDGVLRAALERQASALGIANAVTFAGFVTDIRAVFAACDLFVFPSLQEGGGTSLLDAMACALPVIAAATGGIKEIIEDGSNGVLLGETTPRSIAAAVAGLLTAPEIGRKFGAAARKTASERFSAERMVTNTLAVFERALSEHVEAGR